jgi:hypothetical protein
VAKDKAENEAQKIKQCQGDTVMGDWGYWILLLAVAAIVYIWGYANGYDEGKRDGRKIIRHIDIRG